MTTTREREVEGRGGRGRREKRTEEDVHHFDLSGRDGKEDDDGGRESAKSQKEERSSTLKVEERGRRTMKLTS